MIRVNRPHARTLNANTRSRLATRQTAARGFGRRDPRIESSWKSFRATKAGRELLRALQTAFRSKCAFCERVNAKTVDHFYPKERYPKWMFRWGNLLLCCADCNNAKGTRFTFTARVPDLIDPTREDPAEFFAWDRHTGGMLAVPDPARSFRATSTLTRLPLLNDHPLRDDRRERLNNVMYLLAQVVREPVILPDTRERLQAELDANRPYLGILRFAFRMVPELRPLLDAARAKLPEIDTWAAEWL